YWVGQVIKQGGGGALICPDANSTFAARDREEAGSPNDWGDVDHAWRGDTYAAPSGVHYDNTDLLHQKANNTLKPGGYRVSSYGINGWALGENSRTGGWFSVNIKSLRPP